MEQAEIVGAHLAAAAELIDTDPALAYSHAEAARRRAARLPVAREAAGTTAYAAGEYAAALNEFRALRRMTGSDDFIAIMADCERGLGRHQAALKLVKEGLDASPEAAMRVELKLVEAGAREALGQRDEAVRLLRQEIELLGPRGPKPARARLRFVFAALLAESGDIDGAEQWFAAAIRLDPDDETGAAEALAELQGVSIEFDDSEDVDEDSPDTDRATDEAQLAEGAEPLDESVNAEQLEKSLDAEEADETRHSEDPDQMDDPETAAQSADEVTDEDQLAEAEGIDEPEAAEQSEDPDPPEDAEQFEDPEETR